MSIGSLYQYFPNKTAILFRLQSGFAPTSGASGIAEIMEVVDRQARCGFVRSKVLAPLRISRLAGCGYVVGMLRITRRATATYFMVPNGVPSLGLLWTRCEGLKVRWQRTVPARPVGREVTGGGRGITLAELIRYRFNTTADQTPKGEWKWRVILESDTGFEGSAGQNAGSSRPLV